MEVEVDTARQVASSHAGGMPSRTRPYTRPRFSRDPCLAPAKELLLHWNQWYRGRRASRGLPRAPYGQDADTDPDYGAKECQWYKAFCRLLKAKHSAATIQAALDRAMGLEYPYDWPNAMEKVFDRLSDPGRRMVTFGIKDTIERLKLEEPERAAEKAAHEMLFQELVRQDIEKQRAENWLGF